MSDVKRKRIPKEPETKARQSATTQEEYDDAVEQRVYLVEVAILMPQSVIRDPRTNEKSKIEQQTLGAQFVMYSEPTYDSLLLAAKNHPMLEADDRFNMFLELLAEGITTWGIPRFPSAARQGAELHTVQTNWVAHATIGNKGLRGMDFGYIAVTKKVIV